MDANRVKLLKRGVKVDVLYVSDSLSNIRGVRAKRFTSFNRVQSIIDLNFGQLTNTCGLTVHISGVWQTGAVLGTYIGVIAVPSGYANGNTFRLNDWWIEKRLYGERLTLRAGQFPGQDSYGSPYYRSAFVIEPLGYAMSNLSATYESFDPPSTPAFEVRTVPAAHFYVKSMVFASDRIPFDHNQTGFVPQFRGAVMPMWEIGYTSGSKSPPDRAEDNPESRKGYSGVYQVGAAYNPGKFKSLTSSTPVSGNYLVYGMASQALYRRTPGKANGIDLTIVANWTPPDRFLVNKQISFGFRFNEPLPLRVHNTLSVAYIRSGVSSTFRSYGASTAVHSAEHAFETNVLLDLTRSVSLQPVLQYYVNTSGSRENAMVLGVRSTIHF